MSFQLSPVLPVWVIVPVIAGLLVLLAVGCRILGRKRVPARWIALLAALRVLIVGVFLVCLLQPVVSCTRAVPPECHVLAMVDTSRSMALPDAAGKPRLTTTADPAALAKVTGRLPQRSTVHWFAFDSDARPINNEQLAALKPAGATTDYAASLASAWAVVREKIGDRPAASARVLLVSDGNDHGDDDPVLAARRLGLAVDVLAPTLAAAAASQAATQPAAIQIASVHGPRRVLLGSELRLVAALRCTGAERQATLDLTEDGQRVRSESVTFDAAEPEKLMSVIYKPEKAGIHAYGLAVRAAPQPPIETTVQVVNRKFEVLLLEDTWRWSFKFLIRIFEDDPHFSFTAFAARGRNSFVQLAEPDRRVDIGGFPQSWAELAAFDMIVLGDVDPGHWPDGMAAAIRRLVSDGGRSLIVVAGPNVGKLGLNADLQALLPVSLPGSPQPVEGPVPVRLSIEGVASPFFFRGDEPAQAIWRGLPPMDQIYPPLRKKPGATVLLEAAQVKNEFGNLVVVAGQPVGRGRVLFIGTDTLWKWQTLGSQNESNQTPYTVFWQQALRAMMPEQAGAVLDVRPESTRYCAGDTIRLHARLQTDRPAEDAKIKGAATPPGSREIPLSFVRNADDPSDCVAAFVASAAGRFTVAASAETGGKTIADVATVIDVQPAPREEDDIAVNRAALARLARDTGGKEVAIADATTWPAFDTAATASVPQTRLVDLWGSFSLLAALAALLALDWLLRLGRGYF